MSVSKDTRPVIGVKLSLRYKLIIGFFLVFAVAFLLGYYWFWQYSVSTAMHRIQDDLEHTLTGTLEGIDGDAFQRLVKDVKADKSGVPSLDPLYNLHQSWMVGVNWIQPKAYNTYSYIRGEDPAQVLWVGDNYRDSHPEIATKYLELYTPSSDSLIFQGLERTTINMVPYKDPWGQHVSAYGPIMNSKGEVVGAVGIDFLATEVLDVQAAINRTMLLSGIVAFLALFVVIYVISSFMTTPIIKLAQAAQCVGEGDYNQDFSGLIKSRLTDEITVLAANFAAMVDKVYRREQTLRRQVEELKIEIDETKRSKQVNEIVETEFFRDLQAKADRMRSRRAAAALLENSDPAGSTGAPGSPAATESPASGSAADEA